MIRSIDSFNIFPLISYKIIDEIWIHLPTYHKIYDQILVIESNEEEKKKKNIYIPLQTESLILSVTYSNLLGKAVHELFPVTSFVS